MRLSAPIYRLKHKAKTLSRDTHIPLNQALDHIAAEEGFERWSLLAAQTSASTPSVTLLDRLDLGDLLLLASRPGHGKTRLGIEVLVAAMKQGRQGVFFTLEFTGKEVLDLLHSVSGYKQSLHDRFEFDTSDEISADYIIKRMHSAAPNTVVVIDYLQLLDQKREKPDLMAQVRQLKSFAKERGLIIIFISQIDRSYTSSSRHFPSLDDVRLPNPLDVELFNKTCFMNDGQLSIST